MGTIYACQPCDQCGYRPLHTTFTEGSGKFTTSPREFAYCRDCAELITASLGQRDLLQRYRADDVDAFVTKISSAILEIIPQSPDVESRLRQQINALPLDTTCPDCERINLLLLQIHRTEDNAGEWLDCPRCQGGKLHLIERALWD